MGSEEAGYLGWGTTFTPCLSDKPANSRFVTPSDQSV
jgi:hypothetical protein